VQRLTKKETNPRYDFYQTWFDSLVATGLETAGEWIFGLEGIIE